MYYIYGALERLLRLQVAPAAAAVAAQPRVSRRVLQECRQWEQELGQAVSLAYRCVRCQTVAAFGWRKQPERRMTAQIDSIVI